MVVFSRHPFSCCVILLGVMPHSWRWRIFCVIQYFWIPPPPPQRLTAPPSPSSRRVVGPAPPPLSPRYHLAGVLHELFHRYNFTAAGLLHRELPRRYDITTVATVPQPTEVLDSCGIMELHGGGRVLLRSIREPIVLLCPGFPFEKLLTIGAKS